MGRRTVESGAACAGYIVARGSTNPSDSRFDVRSASDTTSGSGGTSDSRLSEAVVGAAATPVARAMAVARAMTVARSARRALSCVVCRAGDVSPVDDSRLCESSPTARSTLTTRLRSLRSLGQSWSLVRISVRSTPLIRVRSVRDRTFSRQIPPYSCCGTSSHDGRFTRIEAPFRPGTTVSGRPSAWMTTRCGQRASTLTTVTRHAPWNIGITDLLRPCSAVRLFRCSANDTVPARLRTDSNLGSRRWWVTANMIASHQPIVPSGAAT